MKKLFAAIALAAAVTATADVKIGFVDMADLLRLHPQYDSDGRLLKETDRDYQERIDRMQDELKAIGEEGKKVTDELQNPMLSAKAKLDAQKKVEALQQRFMAGQQELRIKAAEFQSQLEDMNARLLRTRTSEIREKISVWAQENGYDIILDRNLVAFAKDEFDVTDEILKLYNVDPAKRQERKHEGK